MFEFIKKLLAGIFSFIVGLLPGKKKSNGYFLELKQDEIGDIKPVSSNNTREITSVGKPEPSPKSNTVAEIKQTEVKKTSVAKPAATVELTFAPKYVFSSIGSSNGRRYPGPDMNIYLQMARGLKTP